MDSQRADGSFPPGRNYTYDEPETPVRNTANWLRVLTEAYVITGDDAFKRAALASVEYLLTDEVRPHGATYHCRKIQSKDKCNGLVGQASPIRALAKAGTVFDHSDAIETATAVFDLHPYNESLGLWERVEIDGQPLSFDRTLNHQIIFAAAATELAPHRNTVLDRVKRFLSKLESNMRLHENGLIKHYARPPLVPMLREVAHSPHYYDMIINECAFHYYSYSKSRRRKERGYQAVNLSALSLLKERVPDHGVWSTDTISRSVDFLRQAQEELIEGIDTKHGSLVQATDIAKIRSRFEERPIQCYEELISTDITRTPSRGEGVFELEGINSSTEAALVSVLTDIPNVDLH
ncbi:hypothetical protein [Halobacterium salinarum]|uniref:hypothetical protein n=1 Tax=Halobacterium salinarum TaxID=2242 RepID=UPI001F4411FE|nr:hypothetical protein [Halobacterium salinarum]